MRTDGDLEASVADIEFLARSSHHVNVLDALAQHLADLLERRRIDRVGPTYSLSALAEYAPWFGNR